MRDSKQEVRWAVPLLNGSISWMTVKEAQLDALKQEGMVDSFVFFLFGSLRW